ncbi:MAG: ferrochelatase [Parachlamydiaceae bacterium]
MKKGLLLVNLGTPLSPKPKDVFNYLIEFLTDGRVIDFPWLKRNLLVRGIIVPFRYKESAKNYESIWTEKGSPLMVNTELLKAKVQAALPDVQVEMAMRYQFPSLEEGLEKLKGVHTLTILPLFPQYASATVGSVHEKIMQIVSKWNTIPDLKFISQYHDDPLFIEAFKEKGKAFSLDEYDSILFSFHGLPVRQVKKGCGTSCLSCDTGPYHCYGAQCYRSAKLIAESLGISRYKVCFQSRLGKEVWMQPYASDVIEEVAKQGAKKMLVFCPSFVSDCLETIQEIGNEYAHLFKEHGGEKLDLVPSLNDSDTFAKMICSKI